jgi:hypothetical protein
MPEGVVFLCPAARPSTVALADHSLPILTCTFSRIAVTLNNKAAKSCSQDVVSLLQILYLDVIDEG